MSEENNFSQPIPLSQAKKIRRTSENNNDKIEISEARLRTIMSEVVTEQVSSKIIRLENSINKLVNQFEGIQNGNSEDAALRVTTDSEACDLALANVNISQEDMYPYFCQTLAEELNIRPYDVTKMVGEFGLRNYEQYHLVIKSSEKKTVNKWSEATYKRLKQALDSHEYPRPIIN